MAQSIFHANQIIIVDGTPTRNNYHGYFREMFTAMHLYSTFNANLLSLRFGHRQFAYDRNGYIDTEPNDAITIPASDLTTIATRIGHLEITSADIALFQEGAEPKWRRLFTSLINLDTLTIQCRPSELNDFQSIVDIILRSADLPNLRSLRIFGCDNGPVPIDGAALCNFLSYHSELTVLDLDNVLPMDECGAGGLGRCITNTILELRQHEGVKAVALAGGDYKGHFLSGKVCKKPDEGSGTVNRCFCRECVAEALSELSHDLGVEHEMGEWDYGDLVWIDRMSGPRENQGDGGVRSRNNALSCYSGGYAADEALG